MFEVAEELKCLGTNIDDPICSKDVRDYFESIAEEMLFIVNLLNRADKFLQGEISEEKLLGRHMSEPEPEPEPIKLPQSDILEI